MAADGTTVASLAEVSKKLELTKFGGYDAFQVVDDEIRAPSKNEVQIHIKAAGVNFAEVVARMGAYPPVKTTPTVLGYEAAGVISAVGDSVQDLAVGDRVVVIHAFELYRTHYTVSAEFVFKMPAGMTFGEAAAIPVQYVTAYMMLHEQAHVQAGETVLVHMAAGGVGTAACQLLRAVGGVRVLGTASAAKHEYTRSNGCEHPIDYRTQDYSTEVLSITEQHGVDVILDPLGGGDIAKNYKLLAPMGRQILFGAANFVSGSGTLSGFHAFKTWWKTANIDPMDLMMSNKSLMGYNLGKLVHDVPRIRRAMLAVLGLYESGSLRPHVDAVFSFAQAGQAHKYMVDRKNRGKLVLAWEPLPRSEVPESFAGKTSSEPTGVADFVLS